MANKLYGDDWPEEWSADDTDDTCSLEDVYMRRYESLMDELMKLATSLESNAQMERELSEGSVTTTHGYYSEGKHIAYSNALAWLQEVMRNA